MTTTPLACRSILVLGGARSGKSRYALELSEATSPARLYLATGSAGDEEMATRIARHRAERGAGWSTLEEPLALAGALAAHAASERVILVDCLTFWLANLTFGGHDVEEASSLLTRAIEDLRGPTIFVSNEVGGGIVPSTASGRAFRDMQGMLNQRVARACDAVVLVAAGLPLLLKPGAAPRLAPR